MFRSKRSTLAKRLWKLRGQTESSGEVGAENYEAGCTLENLCNSEELKIRCMAMLKRLKEDQLESLVRAVESQGRDLSNCVLVPKGDLRVSGVGCVPLNILFCKLWRWPDLNLDASLKQLPCCKSKYDLEDDNSLSMYICCNPYHWSKLFTDCSLPPYSRYQDRTETNQENFPLPNENDNYSQLSTIEISDSDPPPEFSSGYYSRDSRILPGNWCNVAYWEQETRVGRIFNVLDPMISIFGEVSIGDGLSLATLATSNNTKLESVIRTRRKIGLGVILFKEEDNVWIYNRSNVPVFISSPTMDLPNTRTLTVYKVQPGYCVNVFDCNLSRLYQQLHNPELFNGPVYRNFVRISFAKGWGQKYSRRFVSGCPCSLEILINSPSR